MTEVVPFFAVPFALAKHPNPAALNASLRELFLAKSASGTAFANPRPITARNAPVFESRFDLFKWTDAPLQQLKEYCWMEMLRVIGELNGYDAAMRSRLLIYSDSWFHVTRRGGYFALHNHPNASWSGVYCVDPGNHDADKPQSGALTFVNPTLMSTMHVDAGNAQLSGPFASGTRSLRMEPGQLVLFPSWVLHDVKPFEGEGERITVAFNCWFGLKDAPMPPTLRA
jgi:uncharacterized protein (TIGR02466 family)